VLVISREVTTRFASEDTQGPNQRQHEQTSVHGPSSSTHRLVGHW